MLASPHWGGPGELGGTVKTLRTVESEWSGRARETGEKDSFNEWEWQLQRNCLYCGRRLSGELAVMIIDWLNSRYLIENLDIESNILNSDLIPSEFKL